MHFIIIISLTFSLSQGLSIDTQNRPIQFLGDVLKMIENKDSIETKMVLHSRNENNCTLLDWNTDSTAVLRSNEEGQIVVRSNFNSRALALICIIEESDFMLLKTVAKAFEGMRQKQVILWIQRTFTNEVLEELANEASRLKLQRVLVLQVENHLTLHRLDACLRPNFVEVNTSNLKDSLFNDHPPNFCGATAVFKVTPESGNLLRDNNHFKGVFQITQRQEMDVVEFALKYNLKLKLVYESDPETESVDIRVHSRFLTKWKISTYVGIFNPFRLSSLIVTVPCGHEKSIRNVFEHLDVQKWFFYIFIVYVALVLVEAGINLVTQRISGCDYRLRRLIPLLNLNAFRAILGMSFPVRRRASLSLRQLFLAMSLFGMIFSNFFSCKLSALLTKHSQKPQISNFKELRDSGLTVLVDPVLQTFIETELEPDYFQRVLPKTMIMNNFERTKLLYSLNNSYGYTMHEENWESINKFQLSRGRKVLCTSKHLAIIRNLPRAHTLQRNSIYKKSLAKFISRIEETGISMQWKTMTDLKWRRFYKIINQSIDSPGAAPLTLEQLMWLGYLLGFGYGIAALVFLLEICLHRKKRCQLSAV